MKFYIAASWRHQHAVEMLTALLREKGHEVLSFVENNFAEGYGPNSPMPFETWVNSSAAERCFEFDARACRTDTTDCVIYIGPSGKDAAFECGTAYASGIPVIGLWAKGEDFGLMRKAFSAWHTNFEGLLVEIQGMAARLNAQRKAS